MAHWLTLSIFSILCCIIQWKGGPTTSTNSNFIEFSFACALQVSAGPDDTICEPGGTVFLDGEIYGNHVTYEWTPHTGLNNPYILNPVANVTDPITYTLTGWGYDPGNPNLIYNGNFSLGNTGFSTDYNYVADQPGIQTEMYPDSTYTVIDDPGLVNDNWDGCDPSPGSGGNMMVINGVMPLDTFWCQTIDVNPNMQYQFNGWMLSLDQQAIPDLVFSFNGVPAGPIWYGINECDWGQIGNPPSTNWFSGDTTSVEICVICANFWGGQSPLAIAFDDFSFVELCSVADSVSIFLVDDFAPEPDISGPAEVCKGSNGAYTADFPPGTEIISYLWSISPGGVITGGQGTEQITVHWNNSGAANVCLNINTFCHSNNACFEINLIDVPPDVEITGPLFLCPGETASLVIPLNSPEYEFQWSVPPGVGIVGGEGSNSLVIQWGDLEEATVCVEITNECGSSSDCIDISAFPGFETFMDIVLCDGDVIEVNGNEYGNGVLFGTELFITENGCDSLVEIQITLEFPIENNVTSIICPGDSIFLQGAYQTQPGIYLDAFNTADACDSFVITNLILSFSDTTWITSTTCDSASAGTTISTFSMGTCDSVVVDQVSWIQSDSTFFSLFSCNPADTGQTVQVLSNQHECDSLIFAQTFLIPSDSTFLFQTTCDPAMAGTNIETFVSNAACDSVVITEVFYQLADTTLIQMPACMIVDTGTTSVLFSNTNGCDSLVITHHFFAGGDTTELYSLTCSPQDSGILIFPMINQYGCDSIIVSNVYYAGVDTLFLHNTTCDSSQLGIVVQNLINQNGCDSIVVTDYEYALVDSTYLFDDTCLPSEEGTFVDHYINQFGCDSVVTLSISLLRSDTTIIILETCDPDLVGTTQNTLTSQNGCDSIVFEVTALYPLAEVQIITADYNGFDISCYGANDGSALMDVTGVSPFTYNWSNGSSDQEITGLASGNYSVTVTDGNGCLASSEMILLEPEPLIIGFSVSQPDCFDQDNGSITINSTGGVQPIRYSIDGIIFQSSNTFSDLSGGTYEITAFDANDCEVKEIIWINVPLMVSVELGENQILLPGDSVIINAIVNVPYDSLANINWSGLNNPACPNCLTQAVAPIITTTYSVVVTSHGGCSDEDAITLTLETDVHVFVPNIFSPNGDGINDRLLISTNENVEKITSLIIFDRWGNIVFAANNYPPNHESNSWDGKVKEKQVNPGVFAYKLIVEFKDGRSEIRYGDVTAVR